MTSAASFLREHSRLQAVLAAGLALQPNTHAFAHVFGRIMPVLTAGLVALETAPAAETNPLTFEPTFEPTPEMVSEEDPEPTFEPSPEMLSEALATPMGVQPSDPKVANLSKTNSPVAELQAAPAPSAADAVKMFTEAAEESDATENYAEHMRAHELADDFKQGLRRTSAAELTGKAILLSGADEPKMLFPNGTRFGESTETEADMMSLYYKAMQRRTHRRPALQRKMQIEIAANSAS